MTYLTSITQGVHLTYSKLMKIRDKLEERDLTSKLIKNEFYQGQGRNNLFDGEDKIRFEV